MRARRLRVRSIEDLMLATGGNREFRPVQMGPREVRGVLALTNVGNLTITHGRFRSDIHVSGTWSNDKLTLGVLLTAKDVRVFGRTARPGDLVLAGKGRDIDARYGDKLEYLSVNLDKSDLLDVAAAHGWTIDTRLPDGSALLRPDNREATHLIARLSPVIEGLREGTLRRVGPAAERAMAQDVVSEFARVLSDARLHGDTSNRPRRSRSNLIHRTEEWLTDDPCRPQGIQEISQHFEISPRQLFRAFQAEVGMSPAKYLKRYRMTQARLELLTADPAATTVTEVATSWGFWELGRFAVEYRRLFGECPSQTLRTYARPRLPRRRPGGRTGMMKRSARE